jgi:branched-chain amino acid transport system permease protein
MLVASFLAQARTSGISDVTEFFSYTVAGLSVAAILAVGASGLVLTYTTTGVFNFAHGAIGMLGGFAYWQLRFDWGWPAPLAIAVVLLVLAPLFGIFLEVVIFRGLQRTTDTIKLVVSVSLLFSIIGIANWIWEPASRPDAKFCEASERSLGCPFGRSFRIGEVPVTAHEVITVIVAIAVAVGLFVLLRLTRAGIAMRAAVDDRPLASLHGAHPDRSSMLAWAIGCSLAATSGILFVGTIALDATAISLLIVNAYAAAMIGRLRSLALTFVGALILGLADGYLKGYLPKLGNQYLSSEFVTAVPVIVLFVVLLILPSARLRAAGTLRSREIIPMPTRRGTLIFAASVVAMAALAIPLTTRSNTVTLTRVFAVGIVALSLVPLVGLAGQVSLCQWSLAGVGAVVMGHMGTNGSPIGIAAAIVVAALVGAVIALPTLRLSGIYLALATAAFAVFLDRWIFKLRPFDLPFVENPVALFSTGSISVERLKLFGYEFNTADRQLILCATAFAFAAIVVSWIRRSGMGRRLLAMKDSPAACATVGMNLTLTKLTVFMISAGIAGLGGALLGGQQQTTNPQDWQFASGLPVFMVGVVGGVARVGGALFAGISLVALSASPGWPLLRNISWWSNLSAVTPGFMGIGLGRNPNGAVADMREPFEPLGRSKVLLGGFLATLAAIYVFVVQAGVGAWWLILGGVAALLLFGQLASMRAKPSVEAAEAAGEPFPDIELEWLGIERPFAPEDVVELDKQLGLAEVQ